MVQIPLSFVSLQLLQHHKYTNIQYNTMQYHCFKLPSIAKSSGLDSIIIETSTASAFEYAFGIILTLASWICGLCFFVYMSLTTIASRQIWTLSNPRLTSAS